MAFSDEEYFSIDSRDLDSVSSAKDQSVSSSLSSILNVAASAERASRLPPASLVGQWITVEGKGLGKVLAFNNDWVIDTNSQREG